MEEIEYKIYKYELCPSNDPNRIIIGFMITDTTNNRSLNVEETIPLVDSAGKDEEEVCQMAYERVKDTIETLKQKLLSKRDSVIGKVFLPST